MKKGLDSVGKAGAIVNVVFFGLEILIFLAMFFSGIGMLVDGIEQGIILIIIVLLLGALPVIALLFHAKVLSGELQHKKLACILGFVSLSILGSILLIVSKDENSEDIADTLIKFKDLLDSGAISQDEYNQVKATILK